MTVQNDSVMKQLIAHHGTLFSQELGIELARNTPSPLFRWLCAALLMSARISHHTAMAAVRALSTAGLITARGMAGSEWADRVHLLDRVGYTRYDERTAHMLGETAQQLQANYGGDLRKLRAAADNDPVEERIRLMEFKGIGDVGADIFLREVQLIWTEHYPFLDSKACAGATRLGLPAEARTLARHVSRQDYVRLVTALVRIELAGMSRDHLLKGDETIRNR